MKEDNPGKCVFRFVGRSLQSYGKARSTTSGTLAGTKIVQSRSAAPVLLPLLCLVFSVSIRAQNTQEKTGQVDATQGRSLNQTGESDAEEVARRAFAVALITSLADEARTYDDLSLRARVLARAADALWDADRAAARTLFRRAWDAAEKGDAEDVTVRTKDGAPAMVAALRRKSGQDLRLEVVALATRRDQVLGEEFLKRLTEATKRESAESENNSNLRNRRDGGSTSEAVSKRLRVATRLLNDGQIEQALEFAAPVLDQVNVNSIAFLSALRAKTAEKADQRFARLLAHVELDPSADANTVSGLWSYAFTPGFYVTFSPDGNATWSQEDSISTNFPNLPRSLLNRVFQVAGAILLRPLPPPDQDFTSSGRSGKYLVIKRLLPHFDQYAPDTGTALRSHLAALGGEQMKRVVGDDNFLLTSGLRQPETASNALETLQNRIDYAKTSRERDEIYADAAVALANQGDSRAADTADKIDATARRAEIRRYVDFEFVRLALKKKNVPEAARLAKTGQLTHTQRAWAYTQTARLMMDSQRERPQDLLEEAADESRRVEGDNADRPILLLGVARQFANLDKVRAWELMDEAVKSANSTEKFTGENMELTFPLETKSGMRFPSIGGEDFGLAGMLRLLSKQDLYRSTDLARGFSRDGPRATAILAIAHAVLDK